MQKLLIMALGLGMVVAFALPAVALKAPATMTLDITGKGSVTFDHALHQANVKGCKECHHFGVGNGTCDGCHGVSDRAGTMADALAKNCEKCHATTSVPAPVPTPAASCSDYSDKDSCNADSDCRWSRWRNKCRDRR